MPVVRVHLLHRRNKSTAVHSLPFGGLTSPLRPMCNSSGAEHRVWTQSRPSKAGLKRRAARLIACPGGTTAAAAQRTPARSPPQPSASGPGRACTQDATQLGGVTDTPPGHRILRPKRRATPCLDHDAARLDLLVIHVASHIALVQRSHPVKAQHHGTPGVPEHLQQQRGRSGCQATALSSPSAHGAVSKHTLTKLAGKSAVSCACSRVSTSGIWPRSSTSGLPLRPAGMKGLCAARNCW